MKRMLAILLICLILTGCTKSEPAPVPPDTEASPPAAEVLPPKADPLAPPAPEQDTEATPAQSSAEDPPDNSWADPWQVTADGSLSPANAAAQMLEAVASNYRLFPDETPGKPADIQADNINVFDAYRGEPEEFCCDMTLRVKFESPDDGSRDYWEAGIGLSGPDAEGWFSYGSQLRIQKNADGMWAILERGSGGYSVAPQNVENKPKLIWLVEVFCLTEGFTHDWRIPYQILELSDEEISGLPAILDQLTEPEARDLCAALGNCIQKSDSWRWSIDLLAPLLGDYGDWLNA